MVGKTKANFSAGLIAFLLLAICLSPYTLATDVNSCQALPSGDTYNLISDVSDTNNCFLLGNNTIFDGHGYTIYVNCTGFSYNNANFYNISVSNVNIVKNGTCSGTSAGFFGTVINDTTVDNVTITSTVSGADTLFAGIQMCGAFAPSTVPTGSSCDNIYYNDISFTGNGSGILLGTDSNTTLRNATIRNIIINSTRAIDSIYTTRGIAIEGTGDEGDFLVENVFIESNKDGIWINAENTTVNNATITSGLIGIGLGGSSNVSLQNLDITSTTNHGISIQSSSHDVTISNATIDSVGNGLHLYIISNVNANNITLDGNNQSTNNGIYDLISNNITINDFLIQNYARGILIYQSSTGTSITNGEIYDCNVSGTSGNAINIYESNDTIIQNIIMNNTGSGVIGYIGVSKPSENSIIKNITSSYAGHGTGEYGAIFLTSANNVTISDSSFSDSYYGIYAISFIGYVDNITDILLYNNTISDNTQNIILNATHTNINFNDSTYGNSWSDYAGCDIQTDQIGETPYAISDTFDYLPLTLVRCLPTITKFTGTETTNFTAEPDLANVTGMTLADSEVNITWSGSLDIASENLDSAITFANNSANVNSSTLTFLNSSATVVFKSMSYTDTDSFRVLKDGSNCTDCSILTASPVSFSVTGFSNYTTEEVIVTPPSTPISGMQTVSNSVLYLIPVILVIASLFLVVLSLYQNQLFDIKKLVVGVVILLIAIIFSGVLWQLI